MGWGDGDEVEASLWVIDKSEVLPCLADVDDVHETCWVGSVSPYLSVNLDLSVSQNLLGFQESESILQSVTEDEDKGQAFTETMWTG